MASLIKNGQAELRRRRESGQAWFGLGLLGAKRMTREYLTGHASSNRQLVC